MPPFPNQGYLAIQPCEEAVGAALPSIHCAHPKQSDVVNSTNQKKPSSFAAKLGQSRANVRMHGITGTDCAAALVDAIKKSDFDLSPSSAGAMVL